MPDNSPQTPTGPHTTIELWLELDGPQLPVRAQNAFENLRRGLRLPRCRTLEDVAAIDRARIDRLPNCGRKSIRAMQESLARAGVTVAWCAPRRTGEPLPQEGSDEVRRIKKALDGVKGLACVGQLDDGTAVFMGPGRQLLGVRLLTGRTD